MKIDSVLVDREKGDLSMSPRQEISVYFSFRDIIYSHKTET